MPPTDKQMMQRTGSGAATPTAATPRAAQPDGTRGFALKRTSSVQLAAALAARRQEQEAVTTELALGRAFSAPAELTHGSRRLSSTSSSSISSGSGAQLVAAGAAAADRHQMFGSPLHATSLWRSVDGQQRWEPCLVYGFDAVASAFWIEWAATVGKNGRPGRVKRVPATNLRFGSPGGSSVSVAEKEKENAQQPAASKMPAYRPPVLPRLDFQRELLVGAAAAVTDSPPATPPMGPEAAQMLTAGGGSSKTNSKKAWRSPTVEAARASIAQWLAAPTAPAAPTPTRTSKNRLRAPAHRRQLSA